MRWTWVCLLAAAGCISTGAVHFAETPEALARGKVAVTTGAGVGGTNLSPCCAVAASTRVGVGLGHRQELDTEVALAYQYANAVGADLKARYKLSLGDHFAFELGAGFGGQLDWTTPSTGTQYDGLGFFTPDVGFVAATGPGRVRFYSGFRAGLGVPLVSDVLKDGVTESATVPVGLAIAASRRVTLFVEAGFLAYFTQVRDAMTGNLEDVEGYGGYGGLGVRFPASR